MSTKKPRVNVTLSPDMFSILDLIGKEKHESLSSLIRHAVSDWVEDYEDQKLYERLKARENESNISHEEFWKQVGTK